MGDFVAGEGGVELSSIWINGGKELESSPSQEEDKAYIGQRTNLLVEELPGKFRLFDRSQTF